MAVKSPSPEPRVRDLGRLAYAEALTIQRAVNEAVGEGREPMTVLLVEHDPVITVTPRKGAAGHVLLPRERLAALGVDVQETDRGGDVTYHGPGQLVAYPILRMAPLGLNLGRYMRFLEGVVIDTLAAFGVEGERDASATGVWVRDPGRGGELAKVCAMGVRVRKNTTMHGLALNVSTDLSHFGLIIPCGLAGRPVTSLRDLLGDAAPTMDEVKATLVGVLTRAVEHAGSEASARLA